MTPRPPHNKMPLPQTTVYWGWGFAWGAGTVAVLAAIFALLAYT